MSLNVTESRAPRFLHPITAQWAVTMVPIIIPLVMDQNHFTLALLIVTFISEIVLRQSDWSKWSSIKCDKCFTLVGSTARRCRADGLWSGEEPLCQRWVFDISDLRASKSIINYGFDKKIISGLNVRPYWTHWMASNTVRWATNVEVIATLPAYLDLLFRQTTPDRVQLKAVGLATHQNVSVNLARKLLERLS